MYPKLKSIIQMNLSVCINCCESINFGEIELNDGLTAWYMIIDSPCSKRDKTISMTSVGKRSSLFEWKFSEWLPVTNLTCLLPYVNLSWLHKSWYLKGKLLINLCVPYSSINATQTEAKTSLSLKFEMWKSQRLSLEADSILRFWNENMAKFQF